ncbi:MAG TPA: DUF1203 domain-containing protein [Alphaproteobacteria bacterium]|jgi:hypothetical protein|nr:DUF1203 domain-containing protein [Alphaproteobacteria bacterium]
MRFRITGLSPEPFHHLYGLPDTELAEHGARRVVVDHAPGYPDRIEVRDAEPGESVLLVNYTHQPADTPFRSSYAVYVREGAETAYDAFDEIPDAMRRRVISLRAFDEEGMLIDADLADGAELEPLIARLLADPRAAYLHAHYAKPGCYAARIDRA